MLLLKCRSDQHLPPLSWPLSIWCVVSFGQSLSSEVILENGRLPEGVSITYKSICKNDVVGTGENGRKCSNISIGDEVKKMLCVAVCLHMWELFPWQQCKAPTPSFPSLDWHLLLVESYSKNSETKWLNTQTYSKTTHHGLTISVWKMSPKATAPYQLNDSTNSSHFRCISIFPLNQRSVHQMASLRALKLNRWASLRRWSWFWTSSATVSVLLKESPTAQSATRAMVPLSVERASKC